MHRPWSARLFSSSLQLLLTLYAMATIGLLAAAVAGRFDWRYWYLFLIDLVALAIWLLGVTAWAEVDEQGIRWRYWMRQDYAWPDVSRVALGQRSVMSPGPGRDVRQPVILVRSKGDEDFVRPAVRCGRRRREFGVAVLRLAADQRTRTDVVGPHWAEKPTADEMPFA